MVLSLAPTLFGGAGGEASLLGSGVSPEQLFFLPSPPQAARMEEKRAGFRGARRPLEPRFTGRAKKCQGESPCGHPAPLQEISSSLPILLICQSWCRYILLTRMALLPGMNSCINGDPLVIFGQSDRIWLVQQAYAIEAIGSVRVHKSLCQEGKEIICCGWIG